jgi:hypothetical protein
VIQEEGEEMSTKASKKVRPQPAKKFPVWLLLIIGAGVVLIAVALISNSQSAATVTPQVSGGPALQVDQEKVDLGDIPLGETVSVKFEVTNGGDQPLRFTKKPYIEVVEGC